MLTHAKEDGGDVVIAQDESELGSKGPFYVVYESEDREERWGYYCSNCHTLNDTVDWMKVTRCSECGNLRKSLQLYPGHQ